MATKKDLVQAQAYTRRRLTTAFVSGAPGGREVEPAKPLKAVIGGITLSVLLVVGGLAVGLLSPSLPSGWNDNSLVVTKQSGARYVALKDTLYPVINTTSARLLIPAAEFKIVTVDDDKIASTERGPTIGILGAPDSLPPPGRLVHTGWTACVSPTGGIATTLATSPQSTPATDSAVVVRTAGRVFVMSGGYRYPVPAEHTAVVLRALGLDAATEVRAPARWTNLWPLGPQLAPVHLPDVGAKAPGRVPSHARVGSVLSVTDAGGEPRRYVLQADGQLAVLSPVAAALYRIGSGRSAGPDLKVTNAELGSLRTAKEPIGPATWPTALPDPLQEDACVTLTSGPGTAPTVGLTTSPESNPPAKGVRVHVDSGSGAVVRAVGGQVLDHGPLMVIDQTGSAYSIPTAPDDVLQRLGYTPQDVTPVPQAWTNLFDSGPALDPDAAEHRVSAAGSS